MSKLHIITPVKDSINTTLQTIENIMCSEIDVPFEYTVFNDFSTDETTTKLQAASSKFGFNLVNLKNLTSRTSPNYLLVLQLAQKKALNEGAHLLIVESDVIVKKDTIQKLYDHSLELKNVGMIAAVTTDKVGKINFPYLYAKNFELGVINTHKRLSFCCSLLTNDFLKTYDYKLLNPNKSWYDVFVSHKSVELGFENYLLTTLPVLHFPHSSRPWKKLKYTNPFNYYWKKVTNNVDRI